MELIEMIRNYKLLFYCCQFYPQNSGYSNAFLKLIKSVLNYHKNITIDVVTTNPLGNMKELDIERLKIFRLEKPINLKLVRHLLNPYIIAKKIDKIFRKGNYDFLFVETFDDIIMLSSLSKHTVDNTIVRIHATYETEYRFLFPDMFHVIDRIFAVHFAKRLKYVASTNQYHIDFFKKYYLKGYMNQISRKSYFIIPNSCDTNIPTTKKFKSLWITKDRLRIITLGRMNKGGLVQKGMKDIFDALILLKNKSPKILKNIEMIVIGDGEYKEYLKKIVRNNSLDFITFIDYVSHDELLSILDEADVSILASRFEGLSMFALESLATSNIALFSNTGGLVDLVDGNGYSFEPKDIKDIASAIEKILNISKAEQDVMKKKSRYIFETKFNEKLIVDSCVDMLKTIRG